jgi:DNA-binding FadR family transcriptional regulator
MKKKPNRTEELVRDLQNQIISGAMKPGQRLMPLREIAASYGLSRSVVNSAISTLSAQGYLRIVPRHYIVVEDFLQSGSLDVLEDVFHSGNHQLKVKMIQDVLSCRMMVENHSLREAFRKPALDLFPLETVLRKEAEWLRNPEGVRHELFRIDLDFHEALIRLSENLATTLIYHSFQYLAVPMVRLFYETPEVVQFVFKNHSLIFQALSEGDEENGIRLLHDLLEHGEKKVLEALERGSGFEDFLI